MSPSLDPDTASPKLTLSEDGKSVRRLLFDQELPDVPSRFDQDPCVLAQKTVLCWDDQGVCRKAWNVESLNQKGRSLKTQHGLRALGL